MNKPAAGVTARSRQTIWETIASLKDIAGIVLSHELEEATSSGMFIGSRGKIVLLKLQSLFEMMTNVAKFYELKKNMKISQEFFNLVEVLFLMTNLIKKRFK
jgi:ABC-type multidrug transport system ATPase subunit